MLVQPASGERTGRLADGGPHGEALVGQLLEQGDEGVGAGGVGLEGIEDERGALLIYHHGGDIAAVKCLVYVEVAERDHGGVPPALAFWTVPLRTSAARLRE